MVLAALPPKLDFHRDNIVTTLQDCRYLKKKLSFFIIFISTHFYYRFVPEDKKKKKGKKLKTDDELIEEISFVREDQRSPEEIINDENQSGPPYRADYSVTG